MSNSYSLYTTLQDEWIDSVPSHWDFTKIIRFSKLKTGGTPNKQNLSFWKDGTISWMTSGEVNKKIVFSTEQKITEQGMKNSNANLLPINSVMVALNGQGKTKGMAAVLKIPATCNQSLASFICDELFLHYKYLYYYLESNYKNLRGLVGDDLRDGLSLSKLKEIKIPIPTFSEQVIISSFLNKKTSQIDSLIEKKKRLIELLKEYRTAIIHHAVTKGLEPNVKMKDSGIEWIGEIPEHWEVKRLKFITQSISTGSTPPTSEPKYYREGALNWFSPSDFKENLLLETSKRKINGHSVDEKKVTLYDKNTVLLVGIGATLGKVGIINEPSTCNQQINAISFNIVFNPYFGLYYLHTIRDAIISFSNFSTLPILNQTQTKDIYITCPPRTEQDQIVQYIRKQYDKIEELISRTRFEIDYLNEYRTSLISDAVTGKIDVRDYAERVSESGVT